MPSPEGLTTPTGERFPNARKPAPVHIVRTGRLRLGGEDWGACVDVRTFIRLWTAREGGAERANYQMFPAELCDVTREIARRLAVVTKALAAA